VRELLEGSIANAPLDALSAAAALLRGELAEGLELPDCGRYHGWLVAEREGVRAMRVAVLDALVERLSTEQPAEALRHARARVAIDPLSEAAHATVVRLLGALGRRADALAQYDQCRRLLENELRSKPSSVLEGARIDVLRMDALRTADSRTHAVEPEEAPARAVGLVGRSAERVELERHVAAATAGGGAPVLFFVGEPGIGKTRMLEEVQTLVRAAGGVSLAGRGFEAEMVRPYGAWIDALRSLPRGRLASARPALALLLPELGGRPAEADSARLFDAIVEVLRAFAESTPAALIIDDLQWLDEASLGLLHYASRALAGARIVVACAARPGELDDNRAAVRMLRGLARECRLHEVALAPLKADDVAELARAVGAPDAAEVASRAGGNPLFAIELARAPSGAKLPRTIEATLEERFERLAPRAREVLPWAAAFGRAFESAELATAMQCPDADLVEAIEHLERHDVLRAREGGRALYDFAHDLVRRAAAAQVSATRRRVVHLAIARVLEQAPGPDGAAMAEVAHHAALGGDAQLAARACLLAGERCLRMFARDEAAALAVRGLTQAERLDQRERVKLTVQLLKLRVIAGVGQRRFATLEAALERTAGEASGLGLAGEAALAYNALSILRHESGNQSGAREVSLLAAATSRGSGGALQARTVANSACCLAELERELDRARSLLAEAKSMAEAERLDLTDVWLGLGLLEWHEGRPDASRTLMERALAIAAREEDRWREFWVLRRLAMMELDERRFDTALALAARLADLAARMGEGSEAPTAAIVDALARFGRGDAHALGDLDRAIVGLADADAKGMIAYARSVAAELCAAKGDTARALVHAEGALEAARFLGRANLVATAHVAAGTALLSRGDRAGAAQHAAAAAAVGDEVEGPTARIRAAIDRLARAAAVSP
jgi:tetratricopeptide (TPR) repeat protein